MIKTVNIGGKDVRFAGHGAVFSIYKAQFGRDILSVIMGALADVTKAMENIQNEEEISTVDMGYFIDEVKDSIGLNDINNIIWSMAKCADSSIPEPIKWMLSFEDFPTWDIAAELFTPLMRSLGTEKKLAMLREILPIQLPSTILSQEQSQED